MIMNKIEKKAVLITGAARNTGLACAEKFLSQGYAVAITSRKPDAAEEAVQKLREKFPDADVLGLAMETEKVDDIRAAFAKVKETWGRLDSLICNAADPGYNQSILTTTPEQYDHVMNSNARGYFFCAQEAAKIMLEQNKGSIVLIGSIHSKRALGGRICYASSKGAIDVMNRNICYELGKFGIRCNIIVAGAVYNDRWERYTEADYEAMRGRWPLGAESLPADIANAAFFLCSDEARTISGAELAVDSGVGIVMNAYNKNWDVTRDSRQDLVK